MKYTMQPNYIERLRRIQECEYGSASASVEGLIEQAISTYLYEKEAMLEVMPRQLPVVEIEGKRYYQDDRLTEYRNVENLDDRITY